MVIKNYVMKRKKHHTVEDIKNQIKVYDKCVFSNNKNDIIINENTNSWFSLTKTNNKIKTINYDIKEKKSIYARKYNFKPTDEQIKTLKTMFKETTKIYNETLKIIKRDKLYKNNISFYDLRYRLKSKRDEIKTITPSHVMDCSIKKAVSNYKSAVSNFKAGNIKNFRIRYYKLKNNINKNLFFEPIYIGKKGTISKLGKLNIVDYDLKKENINHEFIISYSDKNYYITFLFDKIQEKEEVKKDNFISLDPGMNPFLSGVSKDNNYVIGKDSSNQIKKLNNKIDEINSKEIKNYKKKKVVSRLRRNIKNKIDDMHWKSINYLTNNFNNILIGDLSSKECGEGKTIKRMTKRILGSFRFYQFKQKLKNRCIEKDIKFEEVNEYCTSKTCSKCGYFKKDLGFSKIYDCNQCKIKMDRDVNGARNIYFVSKIK